MDGQTDEKAERGKEELILWRDLLPAITAGNFYEGVWLYENNTPISMLVPYVKYWKRQSTKESHGKPLSAKGQAAVEAFKKQMEK